MYRVKLLHLLKFISKLNPIRISLSCTSKLRIMEKAGEIFKDSK